MCCPLAGSMVSLPTYLLKRRRIFKFGHSTGLFLEAIDASKTELMFEAFDHLSMYIYVCMFLLWNILDGIWAPLKKLRFISLAGCQYMTDWCLSRFTQFETSLEYLDLSNCKRLSAKGLGALTCLKYIGFILNTVLKLSYIFSCCRKLKFLRLEGLESTKDIAHVSMQLEEKIAGLSVIGVDYEKAALLAEKRAKLLSHPNVMWWYQVYNVIFCLTVVFPTVTLK